jgi:hypothetical protein
MIETKQIASRSLNADSRGVADEPQQRQPMKAGVFITFDVESLLAGLPATRRAEYAPMLR